MSLKMDRNSEIEAMFDKFAILPDEKKKKIEKVSKDDKKLNNKKDKK